MTTSEQRSVLAINDSFLHNYHFSDLYISQSQIDEIINYIYDNQSEIIEETLRNLPLRMDKNKPVFELARSKIHIEPILVAKKNTFIDRFMHKFFKKDKYYTSLAFEIEYCVELYENFDENYIKLKDFEKYQKYFGKDMKEYKAIFFLSFHDQIEKYLYAWNDEKHFS